MLTRVIAACLAKAHGAARAAAVAGVRAHARAGELTGNGDGTVASDVIEALPRGPDAARRVSAERVLAPDRPRGGPAHDAATMVRAAGGARLMAVVGADAYGHGAVPAARAALEGGASALGVGDGGEAGTLRAAGIDAPLLVMGPLAGGDWAGRRPPEPEVAAGRPSRVARAAAASGRGGPPGCT